MNRGALRGQHAPVAVTPTTPVVATAQGGTEWMVPFGATATTTKALFQSMPFAQFWVPVPRIITGISCRVATLGTTGAVVRLGVYANDGITGRPGALLQDCGTVDATSTGTKTITGLSIPVGVGWVYGVAVTQVATSTLVYYSAYTPNIPISNGQTTEAFSQVLAFLDTTAAGLGGGAAATVSGALPVSPVPLGYNNNGGAIGIPGVLLQAA